jgi:hypothetical protein
MNARNTNGRVEHSGNDSSRYAYTCPIANLNKCLGCLKCAFSHPVTTANVCKTYMCSIRWGFFCLEKLFQLANPRWAKRAVPLLVKCKKMFVKLVDHLLVSFFKVTELAVCLLVAFILPIAAFIYVDQTLDKQHFQTPGNF